LPDIHTAHPEIVRDLLGEAGFTCGVEPRILEGRDPDWTCIVDGRTISGDLYIHRDESQWVDLPATWPWVALAVLAVVVLCETLAIVRLRRTAPSAH
jgi:hypothetical protein